MGRGSSAVGVLALLVLAWPGAVNAQSHADDTDSAEEARDVAAVEPEATTLEPRDVPNYDGRDEAPISAREALLWVPRVLLAPLYFISEFVLRRPLELAVTSVEEQEIAGKVLRFFSFGPGNRFFLSPSATFDLGFRPNIGAYFGVEDAFVANNELRLNYSFGGLGWNLASITDRFTWDDGRWEFALRTRFFQRPDGRYFGTGTGVRESLDSRYSMLASDTQIYVERKLGAAGRVRVHTDLRYRSFGEDNSDGTSVPVQVIQEMVSLPPGYTTGYTIHLTGAELVLDSRAERPANSTGVQASADLSFAYSLRDPSESMWVNYGLSLAGFWDVSGVNHILSLALGIRLADGIRGKVPFTEQPIISGNGPMSGFLGAFLTGPSAVSATLSYSWPIWIYLDGIAHVAVGNVFDERFSGFALSKFRLSAGVGIAAVSKRDHFFEFLVGFGTS
ncbi:MAG: hypothetical protein ACI9KE_002492, partial [Polyangiales bacterium]